MTFRLPNYNKQPPVYPCTHCEEKFDTTSQRDFHIKTAHKKKDGEIR